MKPEEIDITITIIAGILILVFFFIFVLYIFLIYQKRKLLYKQEVKFIKENYEREILKAQLEIKEQTLLNISGEIHDNIGQLLSLSNLYLSTIEIPQMPEAEKKLSMAMDLVSKSLETLRNLSKTLDADNISRMGIPELLKLDLSILEKTGRYTAILTVEGTPKRLDTFREIIVYRIIQEIITNIIRHAKASTIQVGLTYAENVFLLKIKDNGTGFQTQSAAYSGSGLKNMENRAKLVNGMFFIESKNGCGTEVNLTVPVESFIK